MTVSNTSGNSWVFCANEYETCSYTGTKEVEYGVGTTFYSQTLPGPVECNNSVFGDPAVGQNKSCYYREIGQDLFTVNAGPDKIIEFPATSTTLSGTSTATHTPVTYAWTKLSGLGSISSPSSATTNITGVTSGISTFQLAVTDSLSVTSTDTVSVSVAYPSTISWVYCAEQGDPCNFSGTKQVRYGANNTYNYLTVAGPVMCSDDVFGDPVYGTLKQCFYAETASGPADTTPPTSSVTSPTEGSIVTRNQRTVITADASDNVGVKKVIFYVNGSSKCTDTTAPYTCNWSVPSGRSRSYTLKVRAYDAANNNAYSSDVHVTSSN